ncbi:TPA: hypothetical protein TUX94_000255 [Streptococcus equi subsp. zooepidemicus]|nr:hypothetical protein [Streptococcus equi subsp. zooepidemicus]HEL0706042.1 hypothetical protein [Streptococcus equi subsp. zooepidemicus]HEL1192074.1 hypothetical protein [Streptococcus equi subsp. zooepidemicus]
MRLVRKIIYIGECNESAVYFDTEKNIALSAPKSHLLNTTAAGRINRWLPILVGVMVIGGGSIGFFTTANPFGGYYNYGTLVFLMFAWLFEFIGLVWIVERALYKHVKQAQPTDKRYFRAAIYSNLLWNNFEDKRVTIGKKIWAWVMTGIFIAVNCSIIPIVNKIVLSDVRNQVPIGSDIILTSMLGIMPFCLVLLIWQNNPIRFFNIVGKYQKRELIWGKVMKERK